MAGRAPAVVSPGRTGEKPATHWGQGRGAEADAGVPRYASILRRS
jgi:hypothetical protein